MQMQNFVLIGPLFRDKNDDCLKIFPEEAVRGEDEEERGPELAGAGGDHPRAW